MDGKYNLGVRAGKYKQEAKSGKYEFGARAMGRGRGPGLGLLGRAGGHAKGQGPGNTKT